MNRSHAVLEYCDKKDISEYPALHGGVGVVVVGVGVVVVGVGVVVVVGRIHTVDVVAAVTLEYVPFGHAIHDVADSVVEYVPVGHAIQDVEDVADSVVE